MNTRLKISLGLLVALFVPASARADYIEYDLQTLGKAIEQLAGAKLQGIDESGKTTIILPGSVQVAGGARNPIVIYRHPSSKETINFPLDDVKIIRAPTNLTIFNRMMGRAKDPEAVMKAAIWGLKKGLLPEFYKAIDKVLEMNPKHEAALRVKELKKTLREPLPDNPDLEKKFRDLVKRPQMQIKMSNHYMLMHDTDDSKRSKGKKNMNRAEQRLDLLEKVYETFLLLFHAEDVELDIPKERQMVVLFKDFEQFKEFSVAIHPSLASAAGFYDPISNVAYFYDFSTDEIQKALAPIVKQFRQIAADAKKFKNNPDAINYSKVIDLVVDLQTENSDVTVVSHECTHQMAGNTGLFPRHIRTPHWVHEGLASYFEVPNDGGWAGFGAVSRRRITAYRELAKADRSKLVTNVDFVVSDQIFRLGSEYGYAFGWALTHFMIDRHLKEFITYYRILGEVPAEVKLNPDLLVKLFHQAFPTDYKSLDAEWKGYMSELKTDLELIEEKEDAKN